MRFHNDPCLIAVDSGQKRTFDRSKKAVLELGCVLPEVPDVAIPVLSKEIKGVFCKFAFGVNGIMHYDTSNTINNHGIVSHGEDVCNHSVRSGIGKGRSRNKRKVKVIYSRSEVTRVDDWVVWGTKLLTTLLAQLETSTAGTKRISQIGCRLILA